MEQLLADPDKLSIQRLAYPETVKYNKTHFNRAVQESLVLKRYPDDLLPLSRENFNTVINWLGGALHKLSGS